MANLGYKNWGDFILKTLSYKQSSEEAKYYKRQKQEEILKSILRFIKKKKLVANILHADYFPYQKMKNN